MQRFFMSRQEIRDRQGKILGAAILALAGILSVACVWKYGFYAYNGIDLAYFNQVFWNTVHGRPFFQSIHPNLSIGEHAELAIVPLSFLYALWQDPRCLLILQALALTLPAYAVWRIAHLRLNGRGRILASAPLALALAWLLNGSVQNIALFEFHVLPFAIGPLLMAMLAYEEKRKKGFLLWILAALLVREDVALVVVMIGALAWLERRSWWWRIVPSALGAAWFFGAMRLIGHFSAAGGYKYGIYYAWLGRTPVEMLVGIFSHPLRVLAHILTLANLEMVLGLLIPVMLLPLLRPKRLILLTGPLLQIVLGAPGGGELIVQTHYASLFLPAIFLASIEGFGALPSLLQKFRGMFDKDEARRVAYGVLILGATYGAFMLGPLPAVAVRALTDDPGYRRAASAARLVSMVPTDASVAASYSFLPQLSSRKDLTSLHYAFLGVTQFGEKEFKPPEDVEYVALDAGDLLTYRTQFISTAWAAPHYQGGRERLQAMLETSNWVFFESPYVLYQKHAPVPRPVIAERVGDPSTASPASIDLYKVDARIMKDDKEPDLEHLYVGARWFVQHEGSEDMSVRIIAEFADGRIIEERQPLAAFPPLSFEDIDTVTVTRLRVPPGASGGTVDVLLEKETASFELDGIRSTSRRVIGRETLDNVIIDIKK